MSKLFWRYLCIQEMTVTCFDLFDEEMSLTLIKPYIIYMCA